MVILEAAVSHAVELYVCILVGVSINLSTQFKSARANRNSYLYYQKLNIITLMKGNKTGS